MFPTKEDFLRDIESHVMFVGLLVDGYFEVTFREPNSTINMFTVFIKPNYISISGDCGSYSFNKGNIIQYFEGETRPSKWYRFIETEDLYCKAKEFDCDAIIEHLREYLDICVADCDDSVLKAIYIQKFNDFVKYTERDEYSYISAIHNWDAFNIIDFWDSFDPKKLTDHYIWSCHAISHAIEKYKEFRT